MFLTITPVPRVLREFDLISALSNSFPEKVANSMARRFVELTE